MILLKKYFTNLEAAQYQQLEILVDLYTEWNTRINVISRKDMENFEERHVLHSLAISKVINFTDGTKILDVGTGGGFPGIPLAIIFPRCEFTLTDSIGKKIKVVNEVKNSLGLKNINALQIRAEELKEHFDFIVSRAVTTLPEFVSWTGNKILPVNRNPLQNGILYLKGGDFDDELQDLKNWKHDVISLNAFFDEDFFETKKLVHLYK
jgi:16S rRNA (guanine527-N7)-methyltransferase